MISIKSGKYGAKISGMKPEILLGIIIASQVYEKYNIDYVITEVSGGKHGRGSLHYVGFAVDTRTRDMNKALQLKITKEVGIALGDEFDVLLEGNHLHVEFQPK